MIMLDCGGRGGVSLNRPKIDDVIYERFLT